MKKVLEIIIKSVFIILLFICLVGATVLNLLSKTVLDQKYTLQKLEETNYYGNIYGQVKSDFRKYILQSGLDENVLDNIVTQDEVKADTNKMVTGIYSGIHEEIDTQKISTRLYENINKTIVVKDLSKESQEAIEQFVKKIVEQYEETLSKTFYSSKIYTYTYKITNLVEKAKKILIVVAIILSILIVLINSQKIFKNLGFLGIPFFSTGLTFVIVYQYIQKNVQFKHFMILNDAITITLRAYLTSIVNQLFKYGIIYIIIGASLIVFGNLVHGLKYHRHDHKHHKHNSEYEDLNKAEAMTYEQIEEQKNKTKK